MGYAIAETTTELQQTVLEIIAAQALCPVGDITPDAALEGLGIDSLGQAEIIFAIEEAFDVTIPFNANTPQALAFDLSTVAGVIAGVEALVCGSRV